MFLGKGQVYKILRYGSAINSVVRELSWFHLVVHMRFRIFSILLLFIHLLLLPLCVGVVLGICYVVLLLVSVIVLQSRELLALLHCVLGVVWLSVFCVSSTQCSGLVCYSYSFVIERAACFTSLCSCCCVALSVLCLFHTVQWTGL